MLWGMFHGRGMLENSKNHHDDDSVTPAFPKASIGALEGYPFHHERDVLRLRGTARGPRLCFRGW